MEVVNKKRSSPKSYKLYINRVLKQLHPDISISKKSMQIMNNFTEDMFRRIATEGGKLARYSKKQTITSKHVQLSVRLVLSGELAKHAVVEGERAVNTYNESK